MAELTGEIVPTVVTLEGQRWLGVPMTDAKLIEHRRNNSTNAAPLLKVWSVVDNIRDRSSWSSPEGAIVMANGQSLQTGDAIIAVGNLRITSVHDLVTTLEDCRCDHEQDCKLDGACAQPNSPLKLTVDRDGRINEIEVRIALDAE